MGAWIVELITSPDMLFSLPRIGSETIERIALETAALLIHKPLCALCGML